MVPVLAFNIPPPAILVAGAVAGILAVAVTRGDLARLGDCMLVGGWFVFALTSPTAQFPQQLRPLALVAVAGGAVLHRLAQPPAVTDRHRLVSVPMRLLALYLFWVLLGCMVSPFGPRNGLRWVQGVIIVMIAAYAVSLGRARALLLGIFAASLINVVLTAISGAPEALPGEMGGPERLSGYMHPNHVAFAAGLVLIGLVSMAISRRAPAILLLGAAAVTTYVMLASRSRTGLLAVIIGLAVAVAATPMASRHIAKRKAFVPLVLLLLIPVISPMAGSWFNRDGSGEAISSITGRTDIWPIIVDLIEERPVVGWGINVESTPVGGPLQDVIAGVGQAHNAYLEAALQGGLPGAIAWTLSLVWVMFASFRLPRDDERRLLLIAASTLLVVYAFTESGAAWFGDMFLVYVLVITVHGQAWAEMVQGERARDQAAARAPTSVAVIRPEVEPALEGTR